MKQPMNDDSRTHDVALPMSPYVLESFSSVIYCESATLLSLHGFSAESRNASPISRITPPSLPAYRLSIHLMSFPA